uniref:Ovule protein n=1 Tax=Heterorhabditis bacteriophora TaxID=37862 RepID=A0A1I7W882_HETBA
MIFIFLKFLNKGLKLYLGNSNLIYTVIRKRQVFYQLANLPTDSVCLFVFILSFRHSMIILYQQEFSKEGDSLSKLNPNLGWTKCFCSV